VAVADGIEPVVLVVLAIQFERRTGAEAVLHSVLSGI
jgi:hypothetical protein